MKKFKKILPCFLGICIVLISYRASGQNCTYFVSNVGFCSITVSVEYYDVNKNLCTTVAPLLVGQNSMVPANCSNCAAPLTDVKVTLLSVGGSAVTGTTVVDSNNTSGSGTVTAPPSCAYGGFGMTWTSGQTTISN